VNGATIIEKLTEVQQTVAQLLAQLQASEAKKLVMHLYQARKRYRLVCGHPNQGTQVTSLRRASDSKAIIAPGSTCCGFTNEAQIVRRTSTHAASRSKSYLIRV
jgi:hypothetical protein